MPTNDVSLRALMLERDDALKEVEAANTRLALATARQASAEQSASTQQQNAAKEREEASRLARENVSGYCPRRKSRC